jgi:hypothetical protein
MEETTQGALLRHLQLGQALGTTLEAAGFFFDGDADCHAALFHDLLVAVLEGTLPDEPSEWLEQQIRHQLRESAKALAEEGLGLVPRAEIKRRPQQQEFRHELMNVLFRATELVTEAHLGPAEIAAMLKQCGAPQPADPAGTIRLSGICLTIAMRHQHFLAVGNAWVRDKKIWQEAREAQKQDARVDAIDYWPLEAGGWIRPYSSRRRSKKTR